MKKYMVSLMMLLMSIGCIVLYNVIGSEVLADGTLSEPFFLIPLAYGFVLAAIILSVVIFTYSKLKRK